MTGYSQASFEAVKEIEHVIANRGASVIDVIEMLLIKMMYIAETEVGADRTTTALILQGLNKRVIEGVHKAVSETRG